MGSRHDGRIETELAKMLRIVVPKEEEQGEHLLAVRNDDGVSTWIWRGARGKVKPLATRHRFGMIDALANEGGLQKAGEVETLPEPACATYGIDTGQHRKTRVFALAPRWKVENGAYPIAGPAKDAEEQLLKTLKEEDQKGRGITGGPSEPPGQGPETIPEPLPPRPAVTKDLFQELRWRVSRRRRYG